MNESKKIKKVQGWPSNHVSFISKNSFTSSSLILYKKISAKYDYLINNPSYLALTPDQINQYSTRIKAISTKSHPAYGQHGLFSTKKIPPRTHIVDYCGKAHLSSEIEPKESNYDVIWFNQSELHDILNESMEYSLCIDAKQIGNEGRFVNDYRNVAIRPNVEFKIYILVKSPEIVEPRLGIFSLSEPIERSTELLVSYGKGFWKHRAK